MDYYLRSSESEIDRDSNCSVFSSFHPMLHTLSSLSTWCALYFRLYSGQREWDSALSMVALPEPFNWFPNPLTNRPSYPLWYTVCPTVYSFDFRTRKVGEETRSFNAATVMRAPPDEEESQVTWIQAPHWPLGYLWSSVVFEDPFCVSGHLRKWGGRLR